MKHNKKLQGAIVEADRLLKLSNEERLHTCKYTVVKKEQSKGNEGEIHLYINNAG